ncbi:MAG TPA: hypothetical protein VMW07_06685 [Gallionella sp.]|jgi:predicted membrane-bound spermidine synthase|nr:hypothetical protein [Gallionella sp.]
MASIATVTNIAELYVLFSLTTAITGLIQIFIPVLRKIKAKQADNLVVKSPFTSNLLFVVLGFITSPLLFVVLMIPPVTNRFTDALYDNLIS